MYIDRSADKLVLKNSDAYAVELYAVSGQKIPTGSVEENGADKLLSIAGVPNGVYILKIYDPAGVTSRKVIIY